MKNGSSTFEVEVTAVARVTTQDIDDIMSTALEGGITYWCSKAKVVGKYLGECASNQISRGGSLILYDTESSDKWELTRGKFLSGLQHYIEQTEPSRIDVEDIDGKAADTIIQFALFGELVFG